MEIILLLLGLLIGGGGAFAIQHYRHAGQLGADTGKIRMLEEERTRVETALNEARQEIVALSARLAATETRSQSAETRAAETLRDLEKIQNQLKTEFENLAHRILDSTGQKFAQQNQSTLDQLLKPLGQQLLDFRKRIDEVHSLEIREQASLKKEIELLAQLNKEITTEAHHLTLALKNETKTQGNWGELILENVLARSGLRKGEDYETQVSLTGEDGRRYQPDVLIRLPDNKHLIIDSKVSLVAYERHCAAENDEARIAALRDHVASVRNHIVQLGEKHYPRLAGLQTPEYVLMFLPIEPAFNLAIQADLGLYTEAFAKGVILVTASTLLATLRTVDHVWKQERQNRNVIRIAEESGKLYDKFTGLYDDLENLGKQISRSQETYQAAMEKLKTGKGNLLKRVEDIKSLGAKATRSLPPSAIDEATDSSPS